MNKVQITPIVSIVTTCYNHGEFIEDTIKSVVYQRGEFYLDYIIKDANSNDNTLQILDKYSQIIKAGNNYIVEKNIRFYKNRSINCLGVSFRWISEEDNGFASGLNKGFRMTIGGIMAWINSDDKYHPDALSHVVNIFAMHKSVDWIVGKHSWWSKEGSLIGELEVFKNEFDFVSGNYQWIQQESCFWRRKLWNSAGGFINEKYSYMVDNDLWGRFFAKSNLVNVDLKLGGYRVHGKNKSALNRSKIKFEMGSIIQSTYNSMSIYKKFKLYIYKILFKIYKMKRYKVLLNLMGNLFAYSRISINHQGDYVLTSLPGKPSIDKYPNHKDLLLGKNLIK